MSSTNTESNSNKLTTGIELQAKKEVTDSVKNYYGQQLQTSADLKTTVCTAAGAPNKLIQTALERIPKQILDKFYGCGHPIPTSIEGRTILDLGCGSGRDCFVAAQFAGRNGKVIGIDMTDEQIDVAKENLKQFREACPDASEVVFAKGFIENIVAGSDVVITPSSVDIAISNCVVNLSPDKRKVLEGVYTSLKNGGEFYFSDVYCDRRLSESVRNHEILYGEWLSGALYQNDFINLAKSCGFADHRLLETSQISVTDPELSSLLGSAKFFSSTYRLFKFEDKELFEPNQEDYGHVAFYLGGIPDAPFEYRLDVDNVFEKNRPVLVSGNTATILEHSWLQKHFRVIGDRSNHFGEFFFGGSNSTRTGSSSSKAQQQNASAGCCSSNSNENNQQGNDDDEGCWG